MKQVHTIVFLLLVVGLHAQDTVTVKIGGKEVTFQSDRTVKVIRVLPGAIRDLADDPAFAIAFTALPAANPATGELAISKNARSVGAHPSSTTTWEENNQAQPVLTSKIGNGGDLVALCQEMIIQFTNAVDDMTARRLLRIFGAYSASATQIPGRYLVTMPNTTAMVNAVANMKQNATIANKGGSGRIPVVVYVEPNLYYIRPSMVELAQPSAGPIHSRSALEAGAVRRPTAPTPGLGPAAGIDWPNTITDNYFPDQWPLASLMATPPADLGILRAWSAFGYQGETVKVAVVDDGVDLNHEDLKEAIADYWDTTTTAPANNAHQARYTLDDVAVHGTLCAGLIAAQINGKGIVGVAPGAKLLAIKAATYGEVKGVTAWVNNSGALADAFDRARKMGADIISASWGMPYESTDIRAAINRIGDGDHRTILIFAAGNLRKRDTKQTYDADYPARYSSDTTLTLKNAAIISVGASTPCDSLKTYKSCDNESDWASKYTPAVTVIAPGTAMPSTLPGNKYFDKFNGTSAATPIVAGVVALLLSKEPSLSAHDVLARVNKLSKKIGSVHKQEFRRIDAYCLLQSPAAGCQ